MSQPNNPAADALAKWAFNCVLKKPRGDGAYPFEAATIRLGPGGSLKLRLKQDLKESPEAPSLGPAETREKARSQARALKETLARASAEVDLLLALATTDEMAEIVADEMEAGNLTGAFMDAMKSFQHHLFRLALKGSREAATSLAVSASNSVALLDELARSKLEIVQAVAREWPIWPVHYNPRKEMLRSLAADFKTLQVGTNAAQKWDTKATNLPSADKEQGQQYRHIVGPIAQTMGFVLLAMQADKNLKHVVADAQRRSCEDWPAWIGHATELLPLTKASAPQWFKVGWQMLEAVSPEGVVNIPELQPVGDGRAKQSRSPSKTAKEGERRRRIKEALKKAFCHRFGRK